MFKYFYLVYIYSKLFLYFFIYQFHWSNTLAVQSQQLSKEELQRIFSPEKKDLRWGERTALAYEGFIKAINKKGGSLWRSRVSWRAREKMYRPWEARPEKDWDFVAKVLEKLNWYPEIPIFGPDTPISLTEFTVHTLEHLVMFYLLYLLLVITSIQYELYTLSAPLVEEDMVDDHADTEEFSANKRDFSYENIEFVYFGVFICGIISCFCLYYYSLRPDWNSLRLSNWGAYNKKVLENSVFGYKINQGFHGKAAPRMEAYYKIWWQYYWGDSTYSDHCYGTEYVHFPIKRRYIPGFKRSLFWKRRVLFYTWHVVEDIKSMARARGPKNYYYRRAMAKKIRDRAREQQRIRNWVAGDFGNTYVKSSDKIYRDLNGYIKEKEQQLKRFKKWKRKRHSF